MRTMKIGIVGCGSISGIYLKNLTYRYKEVEIIGVCDLIRERAEKAVNIRFLSCTRICMSSSRTRMWTLC